jgi:hypothetical protein
MEIKMEKLKSYYLKYGTSQNMKLVYLLITLAALALAAGAPSAGSGIGSG